MKKYVAKCRLDFLLGFFLALSVPVIAQKTPEMLCNSVFDSVDSVLKPTKIFRRHIFTTDCDFEFETINNESVLISLSKYDNEEESRKSFDENSKDPYGEPRKQRSFASATYLKHWDGVGLYLSKRKYDSYLLIRKDRFVVKIFSDDRKTLLSIERLLRSVKFND